jgi:hypothetical protein
MKTKFILSFFIGVASLCQSAWAAPQVLNYSGKISVSGQPFTGQAHFKFALLNRTGTVSYWTNDGNYTLVQEPPGAVAVTLTDGVYSVALGNASLTNMQAIPGQIFQDHNDAHLRIWFAQSANGPFDLLTPDQAIGSVPYALNGNLAAGNSSSGNVSNSSGSQSGPASVVSMAGGFVRLIANGPNNPSGTLVLLAGDTAEVVAYVGETTGLLEYSFGEHGFVLPKTFDSFRQTLIGPGSVRLTARTGGKTFANLRVHRANGRDNLNLAGGDPASQAPAIVSIPNQQTVVLGGKTSLIVSASGDNLTYQWKKNGQNIPGATSSALTFAESRLEDNGTYQVEITGANGSVTTQNVDLLVNNDLCRVPGGSYPSINGGNATLNEFLIDKYETRYSEWIRIMKWANDHNYSFSSPGSNSIYVNGTEGTDQHPVHSIQWYDAMKWANARSEKEGLIPCYYTDTAISNDNETLLTASTRTTVGPGDARMFKGFTVHGGTTRVLVHGKGPSLTNMGISGALSNPSIMIYDTSGNVVGSNDDWASGASAGELTGNAFQPAHSQDSALILDLAPGAYQAVLSGSGSETGQGILEVSEFNATNSTYFTSYTTRAQVSAGSALIQGISLDNDSGGTHKYLVRVQGASSLAALGVPNGLADPVLQVYDNAGTLLHTVDNWEEHARAGEVSACTQRPAPGSNEPAIMLDLAAGTYTLHVSEKNGGSGTAILHVERITHQTLVYRTSTWPINTQQTNFDANGYRLPTRDEFVAAARGGLVGKKYPWGNTIDLTYTNINQSNRFTEKAGALHYTILPVGRLLPNGYGIHDIYGNLAELTSDLYAQSGGNAIRHFYAQVSYRHTGGTQLGASLFTYKNHTNQTGGGTSAVGFRLVRRP